MNKTYDFSGPRDDAEIAAMVDMVSWSFAIKPDASRHYIDRLGRDVFRVLREDGHVVAGLTLVEMGQWFGGRSVPMVGIAGVAVPPERRGRRTAARLMQATVEELHQRGVALSALYPATQKLYRLSGYEQAGSRFEVRVQIRTLGGKIEDVEVRPFTPSDEPMVHDIYRQYARTRNGHLDRGNYVWHRIQDPRDDLMRNFIVMRQGCPEGYLFLKQRHGDGFNMHFTVSDMAALTQPSARALLQLLRAHGSLADEVTWFGSPSDPFLMLIAEQHYEIKLRLHWMLRVVDVSKALLARGYADGLRGELHLDVIDETLPANAGTYVLEVANGAAQVRRGGSGALRIGVHGLAALYSGFLSAESLRLAGKLEADDATCANASSLFAGAAPTMPDMF